MPECRLLCSWLRLHERKWPPFGEVNTRYTCCTFLALIKSLLPSYCNWFEFGEGLTKCCKNVYQGHGMPFGQVSFRSELNATVGKYVLLSHPVTLILNTTKETFSSKSSMQGEGPKIFLRRKYFGDFESSRNLLITDCHLWSTNLIQDMRYTFTIDHQIQWNWLNNESMVEFIEVDDLELLEVIVDYRHGIMTPMFQLSLSFSITQNISLKPSDVVFII